MRYMLFICTDGAATEEQSRVMRTEVEGWIRDADARGRRFGNALEDPETARTVRVRGGETIVSDGPFAETKEFIGGFDVLDCEDLDEAIALAAAHPVSWFHSIEVRPVEAGDERDGQDEHPERGELTGSAAIDPRLLAAPERPRFMLLVLVDGVPEAPAVEESIRREGRAWAQAARAAGSQLFGQALAHADTATTVRVRNGETLLTDGPFAETKEFVGGLDIVQCDSIEDAVELAARHPIARFHRIEVRPLAEDPLGDELSD